MISREAFPGSARWDFFARKQNKNKAKMFSDGNVKTISAWVRHGAKLGDVLEAGYASGILPKGTHQSGIFQVQGSRGIWKHDGERRIDMTTPRKAARVRFYAWDSPALWGEEDFLKLL